MSALALAAFLSVGVLAWAGLALIHCGLGRARHAAHSMMAALCVPAAGMAAWLLRRRFLTGIDWDAPAAAPAAWFDLLGAAIVAVIPLGAGAERWRLRAACASAALAAAIPYPLFSGWLKEDGWLHGLGVRYVDAGGAGFIYGVGGMAALAAVWTLGPRRGKFGMERLPAAIPGHNVVLVIFGCLLALAGWTGLNIAGSLLFSHAAPVRAALAGVNTVLAAGSAALAAALVTRTRFGKPDASLTANGWIGGLVAVSAGCASFKPAAALAIGLAAGAVVPLAAEWLELRLRIDDPGGAIPVFAICGLLGMLAAGEWVSQLAAAATLLGAVLPLVYAIDWGLNRILPFRAPAEGERQGLDVWELGAGAYPEFPAHTDEFTQR